MDRKNLEAVIRSMLGNPGDASKQRMKIKNVARPEDPEPTSDKSTLTRTAEIKHKIIDEQETTMDKEKRLAGLLGFSDSLIEAAKKIAKKEKEEKNEKEEKVELGGKTKVDTDPKLNRVNNEAVNPYAVGTSQAMKMTGDKPPLKKSTITKAHEIAKAIKKEEVEQVDEKLKGNQPKLDKNKNGKLDSQDFEMLRKEEKDDDGWYAHREMHGSKGVSKEDWKKGIRMNSKGEKVQMRKEDVELDEAGMPTSVIKHKQTLAQMSDKELASSLGSKSEKDLQSMAWRHGYGKPGTPGHNHYVNRVAAGKKTNEETEQVDELNQGVNSLMGRYSKKAADKVSSGEESPEKRAAGRLLSGMKRRGGTGGIPAAKVPAVQREEVEELDEVSGKLAMSYLQGKKKRDYTTVGNMSVSKPQTMARANIDAKGDINALKRIERDKNKQKNEEVEEIDELKKATLASYIGGASQDKSHAAHDIGKINQKAATTGTSASDRAERDDLNKRHGNRSLGIGRAAAKLAGQAKVNATEETEIDEAKHTTDGQKPHPIMTARKAMSLGSAEHEHADGSKSTMNKETAGKILNIHDKLSKTTDKESFTKELHSSPESMKAALKRGGPSTGGKSSGISLAGPKVKKPHEEETETSGNSLVEAVKRFILNRGN